MNLIKGPIRMALSLVRQVFDFSMRIVTSSTSRLTKPVTDRVQTLVPKVKSTAFSLTILLAVLAIILWLSILFYWSFYYAYIPAVSHTRDVNFVFGADCDDSRGLCSFPSANMSLITGGQQPVLARGQQYMVNLELDMPESPVNRELGMFIVKLDLYTKYGEVVRSAHRAAMINYKSTILRVAETFFFLPMYLLGYYNQKQNLEVQLFKTFTEDPYKPTTGAYLVVQSRFIEIYKATLKIEAQFSGLRYVAFTWPLTSAVIGVSILMFFFTLIVLLSWYNLFWVEEDPTGASRRVTIKYFTGIVDDNGENPETLGTNRVLTEDNKETDGEVPEEEEGEDGPLAVQIRRRQIPQTDE